MRQAFINDILITRLRDITILCRFMYTEYKHHVTIVVEEVKGFFKSPIREIYSVLYVQIATSISLF